MNYLILCVAVMESQTLYNELFFDTSLEVGKTLSKKERDVKELAQEKVFIYDCKIIM